MIDENLYWHMHVEHVYNYLVKYFGIFNLLKQWYLKRLRGNYICVYTLAYKIWNRRFWRLCEWVFTKTASNKKKLLKLLLNFDRRSSTNELHHQLSLLKVVDIHNVNVLSFVNECRSGRCPTLFSNNYHVREAGYDLRQKDRLHVPIARTDIGQSCCKIKGVPGYGITLSTTRKTVERLSQNI